VGTQESICLDGFNFEETNSLLAIYHSHSTLQSLPPTRSTNPCPFLKPKPKVMYRISEFSKLFCGCLCYQDATAPVNGLGSAEEGSGDHLPPVVSTDTSKDRYRMVAVEQPTILEQLSSPQAPGIGSTGIAQEQDLQTWQEALAALPVGESAQEVSMAMHENRNLIADTLKPISDEPTDATVIDSNAPILQPHILTPSAPVADAATPSAPKPFSKLPHEMQLSVWEETFEKNRIIFIGQKREIHDRSFTDLERLVVTESALRPIEALSVNQGSRVFAEGEYRMAFGTDLTHLGLAAPAANAYPSRIRFSPSRDIVYIRDTANIGLDRVVDLMHDEDLAAIQRLSLPINTTQEYEIRAGFIGHLGLFPGLRELILVVNEDVPGHHRHSRQGFAAITEAWDTALAEYYDSLQQAGPQARRPTWTFQIPDWADWYDGRNRRELGVVKEYRRASIGGRDAMDVGIARQAVRECRTSF
jgi:hypothetical protein